MSQISLPSLDVITFLMKFCYVTSRLCILKMCLHLRNKLSTFSYLLISKSTVCMRIFLYPFSNLYMLNTQLSALIFKNFHLFFLVAFFHEIIEMVHNHNKTLKCAPNQMKPFASSHYLYSLTRQKTIQMCTKEEKLLSLVLNFHVI